MTHASTPASCYASLVFVEGHAETEESVQTDLDYDCSACGHSDVAIVSTRATGRSAGVEVRLAAEMARDDAVAEAWTAAFDAVAAAPCPSCGACERRPWAKLVFRRPVRPIALSFFVAGFAMMGVAFGSMAVGMGQPADAAMSGTFILTFVVAIGVQIARRVRQTNQTIRAVVFRGTSG